MAILEASCAAAAAKRHTIAERLVIDAALAACESAANNDRPQVFYQGNVKFHEAVYAAAQCVPCDSDRGAEAAS